MSNQALTRRPRAQRALPCTALTLALALCAPAFAQTLADPATGRVQGERLFDPAGVRYADASLAGHRIRVERRGLALELAVTPPGQPGWRATLPDDVAQVQRVLIHGNRVVVMGWMNGSLATRVSVLDRSSGGTVDTFWCYGAVPSPDGRQLAFVKFYPSHGIDQWESQYRLYDLALDAAANRPLARPQPAGEAASDPLIDVGAAVYPLAPGELDRDAADASPATLHRQGSAFAWATDGRSLGFVDVQSGSARLVVVRTTAGGAPATRMAPLPELGRICGVDGGPSGCRSVATDHVRVEFDASGGARVIQERPGARTPRTVIVPATRLVRAG